MNNLAGSRRLTRAPRSACVAAWVSTPSRKTGTHHGRRPHHTQRQDRVLRIPPASLGDNPSGASGTVYEVQRRIGSGAFSFLELAGERAFEDATIPAGSSSIVYQVTAVRGKTRGQAALFLVNFGVAGAVTATAVADGEIRLAA